MFMANIGHKKLKVMPKVCLQKWKEKIEEYTQRSSPNSGHNRLGMTPKVCLRSEKKRLRSTPKVYDQQWT